MRRSGSGISGYQQSISRRAAACYDVCDKPKPAGGCARPFVGRRRGGSRKFWLEEIGKDIVELSRSGYGSIDYIYSWTPRRIYRVLEIERSLNRRDRAD